MNKLFIFYFLLCVYILWGEAITVYVGLSRFYTYLYINRLYIISH